MSSKPTKCAHKMRAASADKMCFLSGQAQKRAGVIAQNGGFIGVHGDLFRKGDGEGECLHPVTSDDKTGRSPVGIDTSELLRRNELMNSPRSPDIAGCKFSDRNTLYMSTGSAATFRISFAQ